MQDFNGGPFISLSFSFLVKAFLCYGVLTGMNNEDLLSDFMKSWAYVLIAAVGGVLGHMMRKLGAQQPIHIGETALQGVGAAFAGYLVLLGCRSAGIPPEVSGVIIGLCGWLGADATLMLLQSYIYRKLKIKPFDDHH